MMQPGRRGGLPGQDGLLSRQNGRPSIFSPCLHCGRCPRQVLPAALLAATPRLPASPRRGGAVSRPLFAEGGMPQNAGRAFAWCGDGTRRHGRGQRAEVGTAAASSGRALPLPERWGGGGKLIPERACCPPHPLPCLFLLCQRQQRRGGCALPGGEGPGVKEKPWAVSPAVFPCPR